MSIVRKSFECAETITQYAAVALNSDQKLVIADDPDSTTEMLIGIAQEAGAAGDRIAVITSGESFALAGAAGVAAGVASLMAEGAATGELVAHAFAAGAAPNYILGRPLFNENQTSAAAGEKFRVLVNLVYSITA